MKLAILAACLLLSGCASWSNDNLRIAYHAANAADAGMTLSRDTSCMYEANPLLGSDPADATVIGFALLQSALYEVICSNAGANEKTCRVAFLWVKLVADGWNASQLIKGC